MSDTTHKKFLEAIQKSDLEALQKLFAEYKGWDINYVPKDNSLKTAMTFAMLSETSDSVIKFLAQQGGNPWLPNADNNSFKNYFIHNGANIKSEVLEEWINRFPLPSDVHMEQLLTTIINETAAVYVPPVPTIYSKKRDAYDSVDILLDQGKNFKNFVTILQNAFSNINSAQRLYILTSNNFLKTLFFFDMKMTKTDKSKLYTQMFLSVISSAQESLKDETARDKLEQGGRKSILDGLKMLIELGAKPDWNFLLENGDSLEKTMTNLLSQDVVLSLKKKEEEINILEILERKKKEEEERKILEEKRKKEKEQEDSIEKFRTTITQVRDNIRFEEYIHFHHTLGLPETTFKVDNVQHKLSGTAAVQESQDNVARWIASQLLEYASTLGENSALKRHISMVRNALLSSINRSPESTLKEFLSEEMVFIRTGWPGHAICCGLFREGNEAYLVVCNKGDLNWTEGATRTYKIDLNKITPEWISVLLNRESSEKVINAILSVIPDKNQFVVEMPNKNQKWGTCAYTNTKGMVGPALMFARRKEIKEGIIESAAYGRTQYKKYTEFTRKSAAQKLLDKTNRGDLIALQLLTSYVLQHHGQTSHTRRNEKRKLEIDIARNILLGLSKDNAILFLKALMEIDDSGSFFNLMLNQEFLSKLKEQNKFDLFQDGGKIKGFLEKSLIGYIASRISPEDWSSSDLDELIYAMSGIDFSTALKLGEGNLVLPFGLISASVQAIYKNKLDLAQILIKSISSIAPFQFAPIYEILDKAIKNINNKALDILLSSHNIRDMNNFYNEPLVFVACKKGNIKLLEALSRAGCNFDYRKNGLNLLHVAAESGSIDIVKFLVEKKEYDINAKTDEGQTAIELGKEHKEVVEYLTKRTEASLRTEVKTSSENKILSEEGVKQPDILFKYAQKTNPGKEVLPKTDEPEDPLVPSKRDTTQKPP